MGLLPDAARIEKLAEATAQMAQRGLATNQEILSTLKEMRDILRTLADRYLPKEQDA